MLKICLEALRKLQNNEIIKSIPKISQKIEATGLQLYLSMRKRINHVKRANGRCICGKDEKYQLPEQTDDESTMNYKL